MTHSPCEKVKVTETDKDDSMIFYVDWRLIALFTRADQTSSPLVESSVFHSVHQDEFIIHAYTNKFTLIKLVSYI